MLEQFLNHLLSIPGVKREHRFLLAVSGGVDSMVMLDLFSSCNLQFGVAHCNFRLRGAEADADEEFVRKRCLDLEKPVFTTRFDTAAFAENNGLSIQVAARELRYDYFHGIAKTEGYDWIATAHHLTDSLETVLLNLTRGTGVTGLTGIPRENGQIIRPLLAFNRDDIDVYARQHNIKWREDASNASDDYARNIIRHSVVPALAAINPSLENTFRSTVERLQASRLLLNSLIEDIRKRALSTDGERLSIDKEFVLAAAAPALILWELLKEFGFHYGQCQTIMDSEATGRWFATNSHRLLVDRSKWIVTPLGNEDRAQRILERTDMLATLGTGTLSLSETETGPVEGDPFVAYLDAERVTFPLIWRYWKPGDFFNPLGMNSRKKISDFLIDQKVDRFEKENVTVLESDGEIIWVVGYRISEKFKISSATRRMIVIRYQPDFERDEV